MGMMGLPAVMRGLPDKAIKALTVLPEQVETIRYLMATVRSGILFPMADKADKAGREALPIVEIQAGRVVKVAMARAAIASRAEQAMAEKVVEVELAGRPEEVALAVREAMAKTAVP
jgi:hypothetical protein